MWPRRLAPASPAPMQTFRPPVRILAEGPKARAIFAYGASTGAVSVAVADHLFILENPPASGIYVRVRRVVLDSNLTKRFDIDKPPAGGFAAVTNVAIASLTAPASSALAHAQSVVGGASPGFDDVWEGFVDVEIDLPLSVYLEEDRSLEISTLALTGNTISMSVEWEEIPKEALGR